MDLQYDIIIIGSGPAGMTAALYASRAGASVAIIESSAPGGKMVKTHLVENYSGYSSITGVDLSMKMSEQSLAFGAKYEYGHVKEIKKLDNGFEVISEHGDSWTSKSVICATGTIERTLGLAHEDELVGKGVSYCAVCDGAFYKDRNVVVFGGGNSALDESLYLTKFVNQVTIVIRRDQFRADQTTVNIVRNHPKIKIIEHHIADEIIFDERGVTGVKIKNVQTGEISTLETAAIFPYIGADPATGYLKSLNILDEAGYAMVDDNMQSSVEGLFCAGDMNVKHLRQIVTATSDGAIAAQAALKYNSEH